MRPSCLRQYLKYATVQTFGSPYLVFTVFTLVTNVSVYIFFFCVMLQGLAFGSQYWELSIGFCCFLYPGTFHINALLYLEHFCCSYQTPILLNAHEQKFFTKTPRPNWTGNKLGTWKDRDPAVAIHSLSHSGVFGSLYAVFTHSIAIETKGFLRKRLVTSWFLALLRSRIKLP